MSNLWATTDELLTMEEETKKSLLTEKLNLKLNDTVHTLVDLSLRPIAADQGGLCGLAAVYHALGATLLTKSQLRAMAYEQLMEIIAEELELDLGDSRKKSDAEMLMHLHDCKYSLF